MLLILVLLFLLLALIILVLTGALCAALARLAGASTGWTIATALLSPPLVVAVFLLAMVAV